MINPTSAVPFFTAAKIWSERHDNVIKFLRGLAEPELQGQKRAGHGFRARRFFSSQFLHGKISVLPRASGRSRRPCSRRWAGARICRRRKRRRGMLTAEMSSSAARGTFVERLDVLQDVLKMKTVRGDQILRERVKHEGVVRIGRMAEGQGRLFHPRKINHTARAVTMRRLKKWKNARSV